MHLCGMSINLFVVFGCFFFFFTFHMSRADLGSWVCDEFILYQKLGGLDGPKRKHKLHKIKCFLS